MQKRTLFSTFSGKTVLITGGTGSFGKAFAQLLLEKTQVEKVIIFSRDEWKQWQMKESMPLFNHPKIRYFLGDVRDKERLLRAFHGVHYVVHAAALKQVPAAEYNPTEFIKTNVLGAMNIVDSAIDAGVEKVIALSTDKAVNPVNLYGASKLCSDKLFTSASSYVGKRKTPIFSVVRYGNVLGSRGSLLPYWQQLINNGAKSLPVTDKRMTRFWITLNEAVSFVVRAFSHMEGSEIFIPKIPSVRIVDLAKALAPNIPVTICGIRPGEKIHEVLVSSDDAHVCYESDDYYILHAQNIKPSKNRPIQRVAENFILASHTNPLFLSSIKEVKLLLSNIS